MNKDKNKTPGKKIALCTMKSPGLIDYIVENDPQINKKTLHLDLGIDMKTLTKINNCEGVKTKTLRVVYTLYENKISFDEFLEGKYKGIEIETECILDSKEPSQKIILKRMDHKNKNLRIGSRALTWYFHPEAKVLEQINDDPDLERKIRSFENHLQKHQKKLKHFKPIPKSDLNQLLNKNKADNELSKLIEELSNFGIYIHTGLHKYCNLSFPKIEVNEMNFEGTWDVRVDENMIEKIYNENITTVDDIKQRVENQDYTNPCYRSYTSDSIECFDVTYKQLILFSHSKADEILAQVYAGHSPDGYFNRIENTLYQEDFTNMDFSKAYRSKYNDRKDLLFPLDYEVYAEVWHYDGHPLPKRYFLLDGQWHYFYRDEIEDHGKFSKESALNPDVEAFPF